MLREYKIKGKYMFDEVIDKGKKSLDTLLREKALAEVEENLQKQGINIDSIDDKDIERLVDAKVDDSKNIIKGAAAGGAFSLLIGSMFGI